MVRSSKLLPQTSILSDTLLPINYPLKLIITNTNTLKHNTVVPA